MQRRMSSEKYWRLRRKNAKNARRVRSALGRPLQDYVFQVLELATEAGAPISKVKESWAFSPADRKGWDIVIVDDEGAWHPFEVKSSQRGATEFKRYGTERRLPSIPVIVARLNDTPQQILDKVGEVMPFLRGFKFPKGDVR